MFNNFLFRKLLESKMKDVPQEQREMVLKMIEKNPELFQKIAKEIEAELAKGIEQNTATMNVMQRYQEDLKKLTN